MKVISFRLMLITPPSHELIYWHVRCDSVINGRAGEQIAGLRVHG